MILPSLAFLSLPRRVRSAVLALSNLASWSRMPYLYLLRREFEEYGTKIRALNDRGDESPEGESTEAGLRAKWSLTWASTTDTLLAATRSLTRSMPGRSREAPLWPGSSTSSRTSYPFRAVYSLRVSNCWV